MWPWVLFGYAVFIVVLVGAAGFVALFAADADRRAAGYKVLKVVWVGVTGPGGVLLLLLKLQEMGLT